MYRSSRPAYGDDAVGYVEVRRERDNDGAMSCIVRARVTPEHRVTSKTYKVMVMVNEDSNVIANAECVDCAASSGGCKHVIALLAWLSRRAEEPAPTEVKCHWKKAKLSCIGSSIKFLPVKDIGKPVVPPSVVKSGNFLTELTNYVDANKIDVDCNLFKYQQSSDKFEQVCVDQLLSQFLNDIDAEIDVDVFLNFCQSKMISSVCSELEIKTRNQSKCTIWHHAKYARITASRLHEAAHCHTPDGSFVERLLGAKLKQTEAMKRGTKLENFVCDKVKDLLNVDKIDKVGLFLNADFPIFGASPDGIVGTEAVVEIKCPSSEKARQMYITTSGQIACKFNAQMQLQMLLSQRTKGFFCVASPSVKETGHVEIIEVLFDRDFVLDLVSKALLFWKVHVFPKLIEHFNAS